MIGVCMGGPADQTTFAIEDTLPPFAVIVPTTSPAPAEASVMVAVLDGVTVAHAYHEYRKAGLAGTPVATDVIIYMPKEYVDG